jgi:serine protease Do
VNIERRGSSEDAVSQMEEIYRFFGQPAPEGQRMRQMPVPRSLGTGSGFIYDKQGHIVTNNHVIEGAETITVRLWNHKEYEARVVGSDPESDLAVIKIEAQEDLPVALLGDSDALKVGQFAIAIGSARGLEGSVSFGHVSALGRENLPDLRVQGLTFQNLIQTDAAINMGNSGGPLCNLNGEVIGINVALVLGANRIGFSIPINTAKRAVPELISQGRVARGYLGVAIDDAKEFAESVGLPDESGAFVKRVQEDTPAARAGMEVYDVIRKVNDAEIDGAQDLVNTIASFPPETVVKLEVWRNGAAIPLDVKLDVRNLVAAARETSHEALGMRIEELTPDLLQRLDLSPDTKGVVISGVKPGSPAEEARLMPGDVILELDRKAVKDLAACMGVIAETAQPGKHLLVKFLRGSEESDVTVIRIPNL